MARAKVALLVLLCALLSSGGTPRLPSATEAGATSADPASAIEAHLGKLNPQRADPVAAAEIDHPLQRSFVVVAVQSETAVRDAAGGRYMRGFGHHQTGSPHTVLTEIHQMPVVGTAVDGIVLAHRRHHDAIGQRQPA